MQKIVRNSLEIMFPRKAPNRTYRLCSTIEGVLFPRPPDVNRIRLIGRVSGDMIPLMNSFHSFRLTTTEKMAHIGETPIKKQHPIKAKEGITHPVIPHLEHNDYVLVEGILGYERLTVETELVYKPIILAKLIIPFVDTHGTDDAEALVRESTNEVGLVGRVINDFQEGEYLSFHLRAYTKLPPDVDPTVIYSYRHKISVNDPKLKEFVRNNVNPSNYVAIRGPISYTIREISGKYATRAWVTAKAIHKINGPDDLQDISTMESNRHKFKII